MHTIWTLKKRVTGAGRIAALLLFCAAPAGARGPAPDALSGTGPHYLDELLPGLASAPADVRADLAYIAVSELAASFATEAQRAREEIRGQPGRRALGRWIQGVEELAADLLALADSISDASVVQVGVNPENSIYLVVDGTPVVINGPLPYQQQALEQRVIDRFCGHHACDRLAAESIVSTGRAAPPPGVGTVTWQFSDAAGPLCRIDKTLALRFRDTHGLLRKREACSRLAAELDELETGIARHRNAGTRVEWNTLSIDAVAGGELHQVELNSGGDTLNARLVILAAAPRLFRRLRPWLAAKVGGVAEPTIIEDAETLLGLPYPDTE
jgi:hypothetical protein